MPELPGHGGTDVADAGPGDLGDRADGTSFLYSFPWLYGVIEEVEGRIAHLLVKIVLPTIVIMVQTILLYTPLAALVWFWGELELVELPQ